MSAALVIAFDIGVFSKVLKTFQSTLSTENFVNSGRRNSLKATRV